MGAARHGVVVRRSLLAALVASAVTVAPAAAADDAGAADVLATSTSGAVYSVVDLGALEPGGTSGPAAMNADGDVVGTASVGTDFRAFLHDGARMRDLGTLPGLTQAGASDVSGTGFVAGWSSSSNMVESRAVRFDATGPLDLGDLGGGWAVASGVNDAGVVVGSSTTAAGERHGFRWDGSMVDLNTVLPLGAGQWVEDAYRVDDAGRMIGRLHLPTGEIVGYWYDGRTVQPVRLAPGDFTSVTGFGDAGVVGTSSSGSGQRAFLWRAGTATELPPIAGDACADARDVDARGRAVGTSSGCGRGPTRAVLWQDGRPVDLQALVPPDGAWRLRNAVAVDAGGTVAAVALDAEGRSHAVVLRPQHRAAAVGDDDATATAIAVAGAVPEGEASAAVVARRDSPADVAVAAVLAARRQAPLLLTGPGALDDRAAAALTAHVWRGGTVAVVGGTGAVSAVVADRIAALGYTVVRHGGADRYETAARVAEAAGNHGPAVLVDGAALDAPAAIPVAVHQRAALLYTAGSAIPRGTRAYLDARPGWPRTVIGRTIGGATSIAGADRVATAALVAERFFPSPAAAVVAPAWRPVDGALAGRLAASAAGPVLLTDPALSPATAAYVGSRPGLAGVLAVGAASGTIAVLDAALPA